ncbi:MULTISPECIES: site-specific integrase [Weissella]|uniref:site-specific integrase n=1 Tax=Weissella TaxID=46255 RepID=UPI0011BB73B9|nr:MULTISPECIES: site-specific integrase [Weissella]MBU7544724.1 tyrosine-type recombinase/integrase [Weissella cibaria]MCV3317701.1 site-specific integrase [Weissella cibaria]QEA34454.1 site-specific integrase [Weissella soli]
MASFEKRGKKTRAIVSYTDMQGKNRRVSKTFNTLREAKAWGAETENRTNHGEQLHDGKLLFNTYFRQWIVTFKKGTVRASTYSRYQTIANVIDSMFLNVPLESLTSQFLQQQLNVYGENHSQKYIRDLISIIRQSLKDAHADGIIQRDIYSRLAPRGIVHDKKKNWLDEADIKKLRAFLYDHKSEMPNHPFYLAALIALESGLRIGEIQGLTKEDFIDNRIRVNKAYSAASKSITEPKTHNSRRQVVIPDQLIETVAWYFKTTEEFDLMPIKLTNAKVTLLMRDLISDSELSEAISFHGLRHSHVSYLLHRGIEIEYISKRVGHGNVSVTMDYYAHMLKEKELAQDELALKFLEEI